MDAIETEFEACVQAIRRKDTEAVISRLERLDPGRRFSVLMKNRERMVTYGGTLLHAAAYNDDHLCLELLKFIMNTCKINAAGQYTYIII